ncbi:MAG: DNA translocase FtsK [Calditrichaeota bacterium]|nr:DNA translocase FtsK [Calditrichota bacterium]
MGRISGWKFKPERWVVLTLIGGFFVGLGIGLVRHIKDLDDELLSGSLPLTVAQISIYFLDKIGAFLVWITILLAILVLYFDLRLMTWLHLLFYRIPAAIIGYFKETYGRRRYNDDDDGNGDEKEYWEHEPELKTVQVASQTPAISPKVVASDAIIKNLPGAQREFPPLSLLDMPPVANRAAIDRAELEENSYRLEQKLASLGVNARVIKTNPGPVITRYDLEPSAEVKIARIAGLADDIAMALRARGVRILAPIPGEAAVGVEIPNRMPEIVYIREVIGSDAFRAAKTPLAIGIGKDANGGIFLADLARMPHLLIAGATGSGKSVCINTILMSLLYRSDPKNLRVVLIDPKKIELLLYARLEQQHLIAPSDLGETVITQPENAVATLASVHAEMERRYDILAEAGVRSLDEYNRWLEKSAPEAVDESDKRERLPYIIVVIDELADLMLTVRREFEDLIVRLAQMSRAVGIHLVVATQRPSVDVVTGLIKANFPTRIAFQVASRADSRTIIDGMGAEALLGRGDMLFQSSGTARLQRLHGALVTTEEVERVVEFIRAQPPVESSFALPSPDMVKIKLPGVNGSDANIPDTDELFDEAAKIIVNMEQGSISVLQRRLRVGYARAARLIDELERAGIVGPFDGSKARQVLVTPEELKDRWGIG